MTKEILDAIHDRIPQGSGVRTKRKELRDMLPTYKRIRDCLGGEDRVKAAGEKYLPRPNADDTTVENSNRYDSYKTRAVFYNVVGRTLSGFTGEVFAREPVVEIPTGLDVVEEDATGSGITLEQFAKRAVREVMAFGRGGILGDYPKTEGAVTQEQVQSGKVFPTLTFYETEKVINWKVERVGNKSKLTLVVLEEEYDEEENEFKVKRCRQYRVLRLREGKYSVQIYKAVEPEPEFFPTKSDGSTFDFIPFTFVGSENNDDEVDYPPLADMSTLNIAHYRNSADHEESCFVTGQPTLCMMGLTEEWWQDVLNEQAYLGSRGGLPLPVDADAKLLQMDPNTAPFEAMQHKERQMVALGAKLVEQKSVQRTATEANMENASETSVLSDVANNVAAAIVFGLEICALFTGETSEVKFELNTDFSITNMSSDERSAVIAAWISEAITYTEMRDVMRQSGWATLTDEEALAETLAEQQRRVELEGNTDEDDEEDEDEENG